MNKLVKDLHGFIKSYQRLSENLVLKRKNQVLEQSILLYDIYIKENESSVKELRRTKHDFKNYIIYLKKLLGEQKYDELETCFEKIILEEPFQNLHIANTNNLVIDALVNYKYTLAINNKIDFIIKLDVPTSVPFDSTDLCVILGNALDNAIEANIRVKSGERFIKLRMKLDLSNLIISVENSFDGKIRKNKQGKILTLKEDIENHGIGIDSICKAAEKYHGYVTTECENNIFKLKIVLYS
ncbi:ATP-binding protein [Clostridium sp. E02]|uniref:ATP-binding protein n=1 Tax=Clostridium sp. E02 TaxID=2487134 RepID=UPI000F542E7D|nr:ATP-binding protein [Clostridium sp. E02]